VVEIDGEDLAAMVRQVYPSLRRFAAGVARDDPDDVVQEAFVRLFQRGSVGEITDMTAYLRRVVVSVAIDRARRDRAAKRAQDQLGSRVVGNMAAYPSDVAELMMLDVRSRALLYLTGIEGAPVAEAAAAVGCSEPAARMRLSRARRRLRHLLEEEEEGDDTSP
jgi:DNA-directed RNA polymerase specialized sigma24 family protein